MSHAEYGYQVLRDMAREVEAGTRDPMSLVGAVLRYADERDQEAAAPAVPADVVTQAQDMWGTEDAGKRIRAVKLVRSHATLSVREAVDLIRAGAL